MNSTEATQRLVALGFVVNPSGETNQEENEIVYGVAEAEEIDYRPNHVLSKPTRDVYIGHMYPNQPDKEFWYITSHVKFKARKYRGRLSYEAEILNIFGSGKTLELAMNQFEYNFRSKTYNVTA